MTQLRFVVAGENPRLVETLQHSGRALVQAVVEVEGLADAVETHRPDALLVELGAAPHATLDLLEEIPEPRPLLLVDGPEDSGVIVRAMRLGAREYLSPSADPKQELLSALERAVRERRRDEPPPLRRQSPLVAVMGAKGGVGATFVACQLAAGLAQRGTRVALADGHLRLGDVALYLDLHPRYTFTNVATASGAVDAAFLQTVLVPHPSGVQVLAAPERPEDADLVGVEHLDRALSLLQEGNDWVVVDTPREFDERSVHVLDRATSVVLVATSDVPALNHTRLQLELLHRLGHSPHHIHVVVNRVDKRAPVQGRQIAEFLRRKVDLEIPNDYPTASACVNEGHPLWEVAPRSPLREAFDRLTSATYDWCDVPSPQEESPGQGLIGRLRRKRHGAA